MTFNLAEHVLQHAKARADHPALVVLGQEVWSYAELARAVLATAHGLRAMGLVPGERVLMRLGNTPDFPICYLAAIAGGLIPIPTSAQLTAPEVTRIIADTTPKLVVAGKDVVVPDTAVPVLEVAALRAMREGPLAEFTRGDANRPAYIIYTSGTSGHARAVVHAHRAILAREFMFQGWYGLRPTDRLLHAGAFNWTYTLGTGLMDPWTMGATALIPPPGTAPADLPDLMAAHDATIFAAAPGVYRRLLREDLPPLPSLRHGLSAGEKLPETIRALWQDKTGTAIHEAFGMSECSTFLSGAPDRPAPAGTLGFAQPGREVGIMPDGQIAIHRDDPGLMLGYLNQPEETAARFDGDWFLTGDIGEVHPSGAIAYAGRVDDMMNAGGVRVSPIEVETALTAHPKITEAAAVEVRVAADTSVIAAFYVATDVIDDAELSRHAAASLARYKVPRIFQRVDALPRGANNKLLRKALRANYEAQHGQT